MCFRHVVVACASIVVRVFKCMLRVETCVCCLEYGPGGFIGVNVAVLHGIDCSGFNVLQRGCGGSGHEVGWLYFDRLWVLG